MPKYKSRQSLINKNRREMIARWRGQSGQALRSEVINALREHRSLPQEIKVTLVGEHDTSPKVDLRCINLSGENLDEVDLTGIGLQGANLSRCSLKKAKLAGADLRSAFLRNSDLTDADLRGANLEGTIMENTILQGANLTGVFISDSTIITGATELSTGVIRSKHSSWVPNHAIRAKLRRR